MQISKIHLVLRNKCVYFDCTGLNVSVKSCEAENNTQMNVHNKFPVVLGPQIKNISPHVKYLPSIFTIQLYNKQIVVKKKHDSVHDLTEQKPNVVVLQTTRICFTRWAEQPWMDSQARRVTARRFCLVQDEPLAYAFISWIWLWKQKPSQTTIYRHHLINEFYSPHIVIHFLTKCTFL